MSTKESLKIFVDAYLLNKEFQGTKTYIEELYKEFARRNSRVQIYLGCLPTNTYKDKYAQFHNISFIYYKSGSRLKRMLFEIPDLIEEYQFDFAHFQYVIPFKKREKTKYIVTIHDILFNDFKQEFSRWYRIQRNILFKLSARKCDFLCTVSEYSKNRIKELYQVNKLIYITSNGVNESFFQPYDKQKEQNYIKEKFNTSNFLLYVSRIEPRKNQQILIRLFDQLPKDLELVLIGEKTLRNSELEQEWKLLSRETRQRIHFFHGLDHKDLLSFLRASRVFVYPPKAEGFGIPPLEAAAAGIPVLCSNVTAMSDFSFFQPYHLNFLEEGELLLSLKKLLLERKTPRLDFVSSEIRKRYNWAESSAVLESIIYEK